MTVKEAFDNLKLRKLFEIPVIDKRTGEKDFVLFELSCDGENFKAQHTALNEEQENSSKITFVSIKVDEWVSLDGHLEYLHESCLDSIRQSEFFKLYEDEG